LIGKKVQIEDHTWKVSLSEDKQISLSLIKEIENEVHFIWSDWDGIDTKEQWTEYYYDDDILPDGLHPLKVVRMLIDEVANSIDQSGTDFFYFSAFTNRKGEFYTAIADTLLEKIRGSWDYQIIDYEWYYFNKVNK